MQLTLSQALSSLYHFRNGKKPGKPFAYTKKDKDNNLAEKNIVVVFDKNFNPKIT